MKDKHIVGGAQPTELDNHEVRQILSDATHGLESEGYKLLAFVVWQPDSEETGGYFNIIVNEAISKDIAAVLALMNDIQSVSKLICERIQQ